MLIVLLLLPALGAIAVLVSPPERAGLVARVVTLLTLLLALVLLLLAGTGESLERFRLVVRASWIPRLRVELYLGLEPVRAALAVVVALLGFAATGRPDAGAATPRGRTATSLALLATLLGTLVSLDLVLLVVLFSLAVVLAEALATGVPRPSIRGLVGLAILLVGAAAVLERAGASDLPVLVATPPFAEAPGVGTLVLGALAVGFLLPLLGALAGSSRSPLVVGAVPAVALFGLLAAALPVAPVAAAALSPGLLAGGALVAALGALVAWRTDEIPGLARCGVAVVSGLVLAGLGAIARGGGVEPGLGVLALLLGLGPALALAGAGRTEARVGGLGAIALVPGTAGFSGGIAVLVGTFPVAPAAALALAPAALALAGRAGRAGSRILAGPRRGDLGPLETGVLAASAFATLALGLFPGLLDGLREPLAALLGRLGGAAP
jgi:NADH-quinone oxidoreductase subunit M